MKKLIYLAVLLIYTSITANVFAQGGQGTYRKRADKVHTGGAFNSSTIAGGSSTASTPMLRDYTVFPLYTQTVTVTNTGKDTAWQYIPHHNGTVYTWAHVNGLTGTNTSCTVKLQTTSDALTTGKTTSGDWQTVQTYTVSASGTYQVKITDWEGTVLRWIFEGANTHTTNIYYGLNIK